MKSDKIAPPLLLKLDQLLQISEKMVIHVVSLSSIEFFLFLIFFKSSAEADLAIATGPGVQRSVIYQNKTNKINQSRKQIIKMLLVIIVVFTTCWCPR